MASLVSKELDYKPVSVSHPSYTYSRVTPQVALDPTNSILTAGGQESIFEFSGSKVYNLGKSVLSFSVKPTAVTTYKWFHADGISLIRQIQLYNREGLYLCDIQQANIYTKCINRKGNKISDVQTYDKAEAGDGYFSGIFCSNVAPATTGASCRPITGAPKTAYLEPAYCIGGGGNGTATPQIGIQIPLSMIHDSIVGMDKDQYFGGDSVYLRIVWAPATDAFWKSSSATDPTGTAVVAFDGNLTVTDLTLYTAIEQNPVIIQSLKDKFQSGTLSYQVPFIHMNISSLGTSTTHNLSVRYSKAHGHRLKKVIWAPFLGANVDNLKYDNDNRANVKIVSHYKMVNNVRTTQYDLDRQLEWLDTKDRLAGSCILSSDEFDYNYTSVLDWTGALSTEHNPNLDVGLDLSEEVKIDIQATTAGTALNHYLYAITLKTLTLTPSGATFM